MAMDGLSYNAEKRRGTRELNKELIMEYIRDNTTTKPDMAKIRQIYPQERIENAMNFLKKIDDDGVRVKEIVDFFTTGKCLEFNYPHTLGQSTVYRCLRELIEEGKINKTKNTVVLA